MFTKTPFASLLMQGLIIRSYHLHFFSILFSERSDTKQLLDSLEKVLREEELNPGPDGPEPIL